MADNNLGGLGDETLRNAQGIRASIDDIQDSTTRMSRALNESTRRYSDLFKTVRDSANKVAEIQSNAVKTSKATGEALGQQAKQLGLIRNLNVQIDELYIRSSRETGDTKDNLLRQAQNLAAARDNAKELASVYGSIARDASKLDGKTKFFTKLSEIAKSIPILNKLSTPFEKAAEAARQVAFEQAKVSNIVAKEDKNGKMRYYDTSTGKAKRITDVEGQAAIATQKQSPTKAAMGALGGEMLGSLTSMTSLVGIVATIAKFIFDIFVGAQEQTVKIARNMSVTTDSANAIKDSFNDIQNSAKETYITIDSLLQAQSELTTQMQRAGTASEGTLKAQTFLTERMKMSGDEAAILSARSEQMGENAERTVSAIMQQNVEDVKRGKSLTTQRSLLAQTAKVTGQIAASFGFSNKAIAEGIKKVNQFGLSLEQAAKVSESLLNFEDSISSELETELLTGKELNLEKARVLALTGDQAGATAEVMKQMSSLTAEQRKSPLIMASVAKMTGLTADEIQNAFLLEKDRTKQAQKLVDIIKTQGEEEAQNYMKKMGFAQSTMEEAKKQVTLQEQWNETLAKMKNQLMGLVSSGAVDTLVDAMQQFAEWVGDFTGSNVRRAAEQGTLAVQEGTLSKSQNEELQEKAKGPGLLEKIMNYASFATNPVLGYAAMARSEAEQKTAQTILESKGKEAESKIGTKSNPLETQDFVIKPLDKDTISMAGGTKLGGNVEALLQDLISAVRGDKHIYIGANSVTEAIGVHTNRVGNT